MQNFIGTQNDETDTYNQGLEDCRALKINKSPAFEDIMSFELQNNPAQYEYEAQIQFP